VVLLCLLIRAAGFAAVAAAGGTRAAIPVMYLIPLAAVAFGAYATIRDVRLRIPRLVEAGWDTVAAGGGRLFNRAAPRPEPASSAGL
jgi:hypothetical protein